MTTKQRSDYNKAYYRKNREKARAYQQKYYWTVKKKRGTNPNRKRDVPCQREVTRTAHTTSDIMRAPDHKAEKIIKQILQGKAILAYEKGE